jgi:hypothetical protein
MIKYLIDFSRDYYQQTFLWKMKRIKESQSEEQGNMRGNWDGAYGNIYEERGDSSYSVDRRRKTFHPLSKLRSNYDFEKGSRCPDPDTKKLELANNYEIMDI